MQTILTRRKWRVVTQAQISIIVVVLEYPSDVGVHVQAQGDQLIKLQEAFWILPKVNGLIAPTLHWLQYCKLNLIKTD